MQFPKKFNNEQIFLSSAFIGVICLYAYIAWPALTGIFLFDDFHNLENLNEISGVFSWTRIGNYLAAFSGSPGRPISALSFLINDAAWPSDPFSFKYTNLLIHLLNGALLFGLLRQLAKSSSLLPQHQFWPILALAVWLFHPLLLSTQMLVVQRMTMLSATFIFAGLWAYTNMLQRSKNTIDGFFALSTLGMGTILSFLCKENGALLPLLALVLNATLLRATLESKPETLRTFIRYSCITPSILLAVAIIYIGVNSESYNIRSFNLYERLLTEVHVLVDYIKQIFIPEISGSGIYHDDYKVVRSILKPTSTLLYISIIAIGIYFAIAKRATKPITSFAILWFFAGHLMESTVIPLELYFEHRNYIPLLGPAILLTAKPFMLARKFRIVGGALLGIWLILIALITYVQAPVWGNQALMATHWAKEKPMSLRATYQLGKLYNDYHEPQLAFDTFINGYHRGIHAAELPFAAIYVACVNKSIKAPSDLMQTATKAAASAYFTFGATKNLSNLNKLALANHCPHIISNSDWRGLTDALLGNNSFKHSYVYIHIERAHQLKSMGNIKAALNELEIAYAHKPTIELTYHIGITLLSLNNHEGALAWLKKGLLLKEDRLKAAIGTSEKDESKRLIRLIEDAKKKHDLTAL